MLSQRAMTKQTSYVQGLLGPAICQQLGSAAIDSAVSQTAGLLPRDLHALVADAAAAAAARKLDLSQMLPALQARLPPGSSFKQIEAGQPDSSGGESGDQAGTVGQEMVVRRSQVAIDMGSDGFCAGLQVSSPGFQLLWGQLWASEWKDHFSSNAAGLACCCAKTLAVTQVQHA